MKLYEPLTTIAIILVGTAILVGVASSFWMQPDGIVEEVCEEIIEGQTGLNIDLSPSTPEN